MRYRKFLGSVIGTVVATGAPFRAEPGVIYEPLPGWDTYLLGLEKSDWMKFGGLYRTDLGVIKAPPMMKVEKDKKGIYFRFQGIAFNKDSRWSFSTLRGRRPEFSIFSVTLTLPSGHTASPEAKFPNQVVSSLGTEAWITFTVY